MSGPDSSREDEVAKLRDELHNRLLTLRQVATAKVVDSTKKAVDQLEGSAEKVASDSTRAIVESLDEIEARVHKTVQKMDPRPVMSKHPKTTLLGSFAAGVFMAMRPQRSKPRPILGFAMELAMATLQAEFLRRASAFAEQRYPSPTSRPKVRLPAIDTGISPEL